MFAGDWSNQLLQIKNSIDPAIIGIIIIIIGNISRFQSKDFPHPSRPKIDDNAAVTFFVKQASQSVSQFTIEIFPDKMSGLRVQVSVSFYIYAYWIYLISCSLIAYSNGRPLAGLGTFLTVPGRIPFNPHN